MNGKFKVLLLSGSLRKASTNTGLLRAIEATNHPKFEFQWADISEFPVFNEDVESTSVPECVKKVRAQINAVDAVLYGVPEYNFSIASSMKNAYDWVSREYPNDPCPVTEKIGAVVSSAGGKGGERAQVHFMQSVSFRKVKMMPLERAKIQVFRWGQDG